MILQILPPENFELQGFCVVHAVEVTTSAVISALERDLIARDSFISTEGFSRLQERLRTLLRRPELFAGLAAIQGDQIYMLNKGCEMACSCIFSDSRHVPIEEFKGSVFDRAVTSRQILTIRGYSPGAEPHEGGGGNHSVRGQVDADCSPVLPG